MTNFSRFERKVASLLNSSPRLKSYLKASYLAVTRIFHVFRSPAVSVVKVDPVFTANESFFGYYDKSPSNGCGLLLFHTSEFGTHKPPKDVPFVTINLQNEQTREILWSYRTKAFNWQQGARLQWLTDSAFIFNDYDEQRCEYISRVVSCRDFCVEVYPIPVQDAFKDEFLLSLNYSRLAALRPDYGYFCKPALSATEIEQLSTDGVWLLHFQDPKPILFCSLADVVAVSWKPEFAKAHHKVNHIQIAPDGRKFVFLHRYIVDGQRHDRLMLADVESRQLTVLVHSLLVSHYSWTSDRSLVVYMNPGAARADYFYLDVSTEEITRIPGLESFGDGHPSGRGKNFVTDNYPDRSGRQSLLYVSKTDNNTSVQLLGRFLHPLKFSGQCRCDLHPRYIDADGSVYFDSIFSGRRQLYRMKLPQ